MAEPLRVTFDEKAHLVLLSIAERTGLPKSEIVRRGVSLWWWLLREYEAGAKFAIDRPSTICRLPIIGEIRGREMCEIVIDFGEMTHEDPTDG